MSRRSRGLLFILLAFGASTLAVRAQEPETDPDAVLAALIQEGLARSPELKAAEQSAEAARSRPAQAGSLPDPMLSASYTNDGWSPSLGQEDMTTLGVMWSQSLPFPGKRGLRADRAARDAERASADVDRVRLRIAADVKRAYYGALLARDQLALAKEQDLLWSQLEQAARARYEVGSGVQQDVFRAQVERTRVQQAVIEAESDLAVQRANLERLLNRPGGPLPLDGTLDLRPLPTALDALLAKAERVSPELRAAALAVDRDRLGVSVAQREYRPDFTLQAGYMNRGGLDPMWQAGLGVTLPIRRKRLGAGVAEARSQLGAAESQVEATRLLLRLRTQERVAQISAAARIAELYREGILPQGQMAFESALASYQTGRLPFISVLEALGSLYRDRASYLQQIAGHESAKASLYEWSLESGAMRPAMAPAATSMSMSGTSRSGGTGGSMNDAMSGSTSNTMGSMGGR